MSAAPSTSFRVRFKVAHFYGLTLFSALRSAISSRSSSLRVALVSSYGTWRKKILIVLNFFTKSIGGLRAGELAFLNSHEGQIRHFWGTFLKTT